MKKIRAMREESKYIIQTKEEVRRKKILIYSVLFVLLIFLSFICYKSFKVSNAVTTSISEEQADSTPESLSMEENATVRSPHGIWRQIMRLT